MFGLANLATVPDQCLYRYVRFAILGPTQVSTGDRPAPLGGPKRALLAFLLLHANAAVSRDQLIDALWGQSPPPSASRPASGWRG